MWVKSSATSIVEEASTADERTKVIEEVLR